MGTLCIVTAVTISAVGLNSCGGVRKDRVDLIEVNHFFDECGNRILDQIIFYVWSGPDSRFHVRDWRLLKSKAQLPVRDWQTGNYCATWHDGRVLRRVVAADYRETWTQHDPEVANRKYLPRSCRHTLSNAKSKSAQP